MLYNELARLIDNSVFTPEPASATKRPLGELTKEGDFLTVRIEMPGVRKEDIVLELDERKLTVTAEKKASNAEVSELWYGTYKRTIPLPVSVSAEDVAAKYEAGILEIVMKKLAKSSLIVVE